MCYGEVNETSKHGVKLIYLLCGLLISIGSIQAETWFAAYYADANSLPDQQGWERYNEPENTEPWMESGMLRMDTTILQYLYWEHLDKHICFPTDHGFVAEWQLKVNSSELLEITSARWRVGYIVTISDNAGRLFRIGIADNSIILSNDAEWQYEHSSPLIGYDTTDDFHTYRFLILNDTGQLSIDGTPIVSLAAGAINQGPANRVLFGDATYHSASDTEMTWFRFGLTKKQGDVNDDNDVNLADLMTLVLYWLEGGCTCPTCCEGADLDQSGWVDLQDFGLLAGGWLD